MTDLRRKPWRAPTCLRGSLRHFRRAARRPGPQGQRPSPPLSITPRSPMPTRPPMSATGRATAAPGTSSATRRSSRSTTAMSSKLGLAWYDDLQTMRGVQASPLVIDGVLYNESIYNIVTAYDGKTGKKLWTYDPKVANIWARLGLLWSFGARHRRLEGQDHHRRARRPPDRDRREDRQGSLGCRRPSSPTRIPIRSPARRASMTARSSSAMAARTMARAASSRPGMRRPARSCGSSISCRPIPPRARTARPPTAR